MACNKVAFLSQAVRATGLELNKKSTTKPKSATYVGGYNQEKVGGGGVMILCSHDRKIKMYKCSS
jgi:hypothetical protein